MTLIKRNDILLAWALLVALTAASWWLGTDHGIAVAAASTVILLVAFAKVMVIGYSFMELRHSAAVLRVAFFGLTAIICTVLVGIYLNV
jgi:heme/copper-type cytochrome/quinol oxidase subunit 4